MVSSLSNLGNNLVLGIHKVKYGHDHRICEKSGIKYKDSECCLEYASFKDDLRECYCLYCNKSY